jgi:hypothetical protein
MLQLEYTVPDGQVDNTRSQYPLSFHHEAIVGVPNIKIRCERIILDYFR